VVGAISSSTYGASPEVLEVDLRLARRVLFAMLPGRCPSSSKFTVAARCRPANGIGGDFYQFVEKRVPAWEGWGRHAGTGPPQGSVGILVGDVAGHGISSALVMALASQLFARVAAGAPSPAVALTRMNRALKEAIQGSGVHFLTAVYAELDGRTGRLKVARGGHTDPLLFRPAEATCKALNVPGMLMGMFDEAYVERVVQLAEGDRVIFYTDGVPDAVNCVREHYGLERLKRVILESKEATPETLVANIFRDVASFTEAPEIPDDMTVVVLGIRRKGEREANGEGTPT
jgi:sigma-B regulation protein RsbU (phosphoserine phosphatase)